MKKIIFLLMIVFAVACFAEEIKFNFPADTTLLEISAQTNIPVKKITQNLKPDNQTESKVKGKEDKEDENIEIVDEVAKDDNTSSEDKEDKES